MKSTEMDESKATGEVNGHDGVHREVAAPTRVCGGEGFVTMRVRDGGAFKWRRVCDGGSMGFEGDGFSFVFFSDEEE